MYSPNIIEKRIAQARKAGIPIRRRPRDESIEISKRLNDLRYSPKGELLPDGQLQRPLLDEERAFIESERAMCKLDFEYYAVRYHSVERDPGVGTDSGIGVSKLLESQRAFLRAIGRREEAVHQEWIQFKHTEGIRAYAHKCRQVAFTSLIRALTLHRMLLWPGTRAFAGALDPDGCGELYKRDKITLDHLPFWLHPGEIYPDVKDQEIGFPSPISSRLRYQPENQKTWIAVGTQCDVSHLTEVSMWASPHQIGFSFAPALPKGRMTLHVQEATSAGKGNYWQEVTEACRKKLTGYESWIYIFVPWYMNRLKYRANAPEGWEPDEHTVEHLHLIERTSPEFCEGMTIHPSKAQLYWWQTERAKYSRDDKLASFLASYPATPEQSFVNWSQGALPVELLEKMELDLRDPMCYEVEAAG